MESIKSIISKEPEKVNRTAFLELAKKEGTSTVGTGVHTVKLLRGEPSTKNNYKTGKPEEGIDLFFEEDGIEKKYFVPMYVNDKNSDKYGKFHYLFEKFADIPEGSILEMNYKKNGMTGYIEVRAAGVSGKEADIPVIEDNQVPPEAYEGN